MSPPRPQASRGGNGRAGRAIRHAKVAGAVMVAVCGIGQAVRAIRYAQSRRRGDGGCVWHRLGRHGDSVLSESVSVTIRRREQSAWTVVSVGGELDVMGAPALREAVVTAVADGAVRLVIDLTALDFVDSFGIGAVVAALKRLRQRGGDLVLVCPTKRIRRVFEICDLDQILVIGDSLEGVTASTGRVR